MNYSTDSHHLSPDLLILMLDDELNTGARLDAETHLSLCESCRLELASLQQLSGQIENAVQAVALPEMHSVRQNLERALQPEGPTGQPVNHPSAVMRRFGWGMGIAATLAFGVLMATRYDFVPPSNSTDSAQVSNSAAAGIIEVDGEKFMPVPNSNADLSTAAPHIVQMQVPVSSLADIGIVFEPVTTRISTGSEAERSVLADVLVGVDGQPRGVHVIGLE